MSNDRPGGWYVYMLRCRGGSIYTGITKDLRARWDAHRSGRGARYTRSFPPVSTVAAWRAPDRGIAARAEARIKGMGAEEKEGLGEVDAMAALAAEFDGVSPLPPGAFPDRAEEAPGLRT